MKLRMRYMLTALLLLPLLPLSAVEVKNCSELKWRRDKPYDYYAAETREPTGTFRYGLLKMVEGSHFTESVRTLEAGYRGNQPADILFTLGSIPNHPAALDAFSRYERRYYDSQTFRERKDTEPPEYAAECFFARAAAVFPQQASTYLVWGIHYFRNNNFEKSVEKFQIAHQIAPDSAEINYNLGLAYLEINELEQAKKHAVLAYDAGFPLPGLKNKITAMELKTGKRTNE